MRDPEPRQFDEAPVIVVVGSSTRFLSGISYYTHRLSVALAEHQRVSVVLMRQIIPRRFYPGRARVGASITNVSYPADMEVVDGVDWHGIGLLRAIRLLLRARPDMVIFQWWTGAVLHLYLPLGLIARLLRSKVVIEYHETQDTGEARIPGAAAYVRLVARSFTRLAAASVVHSESDVKQVSASFGVGDRPIVVIPHGPFDQYALATPLREAPADSINLLFFGTIRPYKGLEDLVSAFNGLSPQAAERFWLTVVGETWEGWGLPAELISASPHRARITFVNRYVTDAELSGHIAGADVIVLPYRRSSASGPLHATMTAGLPVIVTRVGGLVEAAADYEGTVFVEPGDLEGMRGALGTAAEMVGRRFADPHSWDNTAAKYKVLLDQLSLADTERGSAAASHRAEAQSRATVRYSARPSTTGGPAAVDAARQESVDGPDLPVISVVIPTTGRNTLGQAVESALNQSYPPSEVLIVFDLPEVPADARFNSRRVRCLSTGGAKGPNAARATGVAAAHGEAIAFLDDDDYWYPPKLELQARLLAETRERGRLAVIVATSDAVTPDGEVLLTGPKLELRRDRPIADSLFVRREVSQSLSFGPSGLLVDARLLESIPLGRDLRLHEDWDWLLRAGELPATEFVAVDTPLVAYRLQISRHTTTAEPQWRLSQAWIDQNRDRMSRRAYGDFLLTVTASIALGERAHLAAVRIAARAMLRGRPGLPAMVFILGVAALPNGLRERLHRWRRRGLRRVNALRPGTGDATRAPNP